METLPQFIVSSKPENNKTIKLPPKIHYLRILHQTLTNNYYVIDK